MSNMANSLIEHGKIKTTTARAGELQSRVEKLITLARKGDVHSRRQAMRILHDRDKVKKLFDEIAPEFKNTPGGYTRRAFYKRRMGDGASISVVELNLEKKFVAEAGKKGKKGKKASSGESEKGKAAKVSRKKKKADKEALED